MVAVDRCSLKFIIGISAHNYLEANIIWSKKVFSLFSNERSGLVALFTAVDIHVHYAWRVRCYRISRISDLVI